MCIGVNQLLRYRHAWCRSCRQKAAQVFRRSLVTDRPEIPLLRDSLMAPFVSMINATRQMRGSVLWREWYPYCLPRLYLLPLPLHTHSMVMAYHEHEEWTVGVHLRAEQYQLLSASTAGDVRFWDTRQPRSVKVVQAEPGYLAAFAVHDYAPVFATYVQESHFFHCHSLMNNDSCPTSLAFSVVAATSRSRRSTCTAPRSQQYATMKASSDSASRH